MSSHSEFLQRLDASDPGRFSLTADQGQAMLTVHPPGAQGKPVVLSSVIARLELMGLSGWDKARIAEIVAVCDGRPHAVCPWVEPAPVDAQVHVLIAEDAMSADIEITPPAFQGKEATLADLHVALQTAGVLHGIEESSLDRLLAMQGEEPGAGALPLRFRSAVRLTVAHGTAPRPGQPAQIKHSFDPAPRKAPDADPSSRVDFRKLHVIQTCEENTLLARILPGLSGEMGLTVRGEPITLSEPHKVTLLAGHGARMEGDSLFADIAGQVRISERDGLTTISVEEILKLKNVDFSTGHIDFPGTVLVEERILEGFKVEAGGDIIAGKSVGQVILISAGDIILSGGAAGNAIIQAGGDIYARFVQNSTLSSKGSIMIEEMAMNSRLTAGAAILLETGRGELMGGESVASQRIVCRKAGSRAETRTGLTAGIKPEVMEELLRMENELRESTETLRRIEAHLLQIEESQRKHGKSDQETYDKLKTLSEHYRSIQENLQKQRERIYATLEPDAGAEIIVLEAIYPGVEITFGAGIRRYVQERKPSFLYTRFVPGEGRVMVLHT
ncbi:MAG: DUF342 domain-containing protein [Spirochaetales bacterium]|nr:DUF342 domain-containing protein [Spirochaetales bacterium]